MTELAVTNRDALCLWLFLPDTRPVASQARDRHSDGATQSTAAESALVSAVLSGDDEAFARIVETYQAPLAVQLTRFSRNPDIVGELVHDTFVEAFTSLRSFKGRSPLLHWLRKIAIRVGYRFWRRQSAQSHAQLTESQLQDIAAVAPTDAAETLSAMFGLLSPRDRLVLTLLYWDGCSVAEAADLAGWSESTVKVQAHRARKRLKKLIEDLQ